MSIKNNNWDLESLLEGKSIDYLINSYKQQILWFIKNKNTFLNSLSSFKQWLDNELSLAKTRNRLSNYLSNHYNEDISNKKWTGLIQKLNFLSTEFSIQLSNLSNIYIKNKDLIKKYLAKDKSLTKYQRSFYLIFRDEPHILGDEVEKHLSNLSADSDCMDDVFTTLTDNDLKFSDALDSKGKIHKITTLADASKLLENSDRVLRKNVWNNINDAYFNIRNTLTKTLYYNYLRANRWAKTRNFKDYVNCCLYDDEVDENFLLSMYENIKSFSNIYCDFSKSKRQYMKKVLNLKQLEPWDLSVNYLKLPNTTIEKAKKIVLNVLKIFGDEYINVVKKAFSENWISWLPKKGKNSGAYSIGGIYGLKKYYILMNFDNTIDSIFTLIHELGHSLNSYYCCKKQDIYCGDKIFYAEIASNVNEILLSFYLINQKNIDEKVKKYLLGKMISNFFGSTTRQIILSNFEYEANKTINSGLPFTPEYAMDLYLNCIKKYQNPTNKQINALKSKYKKSLASILTIPHFYANNFYVYKYSIGQIVGIYIANEISNGNKKILNKYFDFLSSGTSSSPLEIIRLLGVDLTKPFIYNEAKSIIKKYIDIYKKIN